MGLLQHGVGCGYIIIGKQMYNFILWGNTLLGAYWLYSGDNGLAVINLGIAAFMLIQTMRVRP